LNPEVLEDKKPKSCFMSCGLNIFSSGAQRITQCTGYLYPYRWVYNKKANTPVEYWLISN